MSEMNYNIVLALSIYAFIMIIWMMVKEIKFKSRSKINYRNFNKHKKYFNLKYSKTIIIGNLLFIIVSCLFSLHILGDPVYRIYLYFIGLLELVLVTSVGLHVTSIKYNKDLSIYINYHKIISDSYENKDSLLDNINHLKSKFQNLQVECIKLENVFKNYVLDFNGIEDLKETLFPLKQVITTQLDIINGFDADITSKFDESIKYYIVTGQYNDFNVSAFKSVDQTSLDQILMEIEHDQKQVLLNFSLSQLQYGKLISIEQLRHMVLKLIQLNVNLGDEFIVETLNYCQSYVSERNKIVELLHHHHLISVNVMTDYVNKLDLSWVYDTLDLQKYEKQDLFDIALSLMVHNASLSGFNFLTLCDSEQYSIIKKSVKDIKVDNETKNMFITFSQIFSTENAFYNPSIRYENIAIVLKQYYEDYASTDENYSKVIAILNGKSFETEAKNLEQMYESIKSDYKILFKESIKTLFFYSKSVCTKINEVIYDKILNLYTEYRRNLCINELKILDDLLISLILIYENDEKIVQNIYQKLEQKVNVLGLNINHLTFPKKLDVGKKVLTHLTQNTVSFIRVLNRVENGRLVLDHLMNI